MVTISGKDITRENGGFPTLYDVGYSLSRLPRFNGYTTELWTGLHHLYACHLYALYKDLGAKVEFYALTHDAHESVTGDNCPPWKTDETRVLQQELDVRFYTGLGVGVADSFTARIVKTIDNQMVYAEAKAFAPQVADHILVPGPNFRDSIDLQDTASSDAVYDAKHSLEAFILDANSCGVIYKELVTAALERMKKISESSSQS